MSFSHDLWHHALKLLSDPESRTSDVQLRRSVSSAYYALFHHINLSAVQVIAPNVRPETNHRIQRWFEHAEMKRVCGRFLSATLDKPLLGLIGPSASPDLRTVAQSFITLQDARHRADYDLSYGLSWIEARQMIVLAGNAIEAWDRISGTEEANIFILSLLLWRNWEKER